jgi:zinc D-Ala-D-Ala dipeptidase
MRRALVLLLALVFLLAGPALAAGKEDELLHSAGLLEPASLDASFVLDIRYATANNFTGRPVYPSARCFLRGDVAKRLVLVQQELRGKGLGLKLYDCYRPFSVQEAFWRIVPDERYVLEPRRENGVIVKSSRHNRGAAVDVTLVDGQGRELPMPTDYDDFSERAHRGHAGATAEARANSALLEQAMLRQGFAPLPTEWWHFDAPGWERHAPLDLPLPRAGR